MRKVVGVPETLYENNHSDDPKIVAQVLPEAAEHHHRGPDERQVADGVTYPLQKGDDPHKGGEPFLTFHPCNDLATRRLFTADGAPAYGGCSNFRQIQL